MKQSNSNKNRWIWVAVLLLFVLVCLSVFILTSRLNPFLPNDEGAIVLNDGSDSNEDTGDDDSATADGNSSTSNGTATGNAEPVYNPDFYVTDGEIAWGTNTSVELFHVFYEDGEQNISVKSDDGDTIIAPGTENSYTFKLKNSGDVALDYIVTVDAYVTPSDITIPVTARLNRYDGTWVVGDLDTYVDIPTFDVAQDTGTIGAGKYAYYTLDWVWPFESGDDAWDTVLGDMAVEQDVILTIAISTVSKISNNPDDTSGLTPPKTGDDSMIVLWYGLAIISLILLLILIVYLIREKYKAKMEEKAVERS